MIGDLSPKRLSLKRVLDYIARRSKAEVLGNIVVIEVISGLKK